MKLKCAHLGCTETKLNMNNTKQPTLCKLDLVQVLDKATSAFDVLLTSPCSANSPCQYNLVVRIIFGEIECFPVGAIQSYVVQTTFFKQLQYSKIKNG